MQHVVKKRETGFFGNSRVLFICQLLLGGTFIFASLPKIFDPHAFAEAIIKYDIVSSGVAYQIALVLPFIELIFGILIIMDVWTRGCAIVLGSMLFIFIIALLSAIIRRLDIECGCFWDTVSTGKGAKSALWVDVLRDLFLLIPAYILYTHKSNPKRESHGNSLPAL